MKTWKARLEMMKEVIPINTDTEGCSRCIKAQYYKMGFTNFTRSLIGGGRCSDGFIATGVMEIIYEDKLQGEGD